MYKVHLHDKFLDGTRNDDDHVDHQHLSPEEEDALADFTYCITQHEDLDGKNKESWTDKNGAPIDAPTYEKHKLWHYHCGPYDSEGSIKTHYTLPQNLKGATSAAAIHYIKYPQEQIVLVIGFSRIHNPFPKSESRSNPLRYRAALSRSLINALIKAALS